MMFKRVRKQLFVLTALLFAFTASHADAMQAEFENGMKIDADVTVGYGVAMRLKDQSDELLTIDKINNDDGNRNFNKGNLTSNRFSIIADIDVQYKDFGVFVRPRAFYDFAYSAGNANDSPFTNNNYLAGVINNPDEFADETDDSHRDRVEFLDAFAYAGFDIGGRYLQLRAGRQVIQWGESLYLQGGISAAMAHLDATAANAPGVELKEIFLPSASVYGRMDITDTVAFGAYYQFEWEKTLLNESGSYFSNTDFLSDAGYLLITPYGNLRRGEDDEPDDQGQFGLSLMYRADWLAETEFGLYFINYHEKTPQLTTDFLSGTYHLSYAEDVKLYGFSFSSLIGSTNLSGEVSLRDGFPVPTSNGLEDAQLLQAQVSWLHSFAGIPFADRLSLNGEVGFNTVLDYSDEELNGKDKYAVGYSVTVTPQWYQVLPDLDLSVPINFKGAPKGLSVNTSTFEERANSGSIGLDFVYKNAYKVSLKYVDYFNNCLSLNSTTPKKDRDYISFNFKYTF